MGSAKDLYDRDFFKWCQQTAQLLREGRPVEVNLERVAEEIDDMGKRDRRAATNRLRILITHLLKWRFQADKRSASWTSTIVEQRSRIQLILEDSPSLKNEVLAHLNGIYRQAARNAAREMCSGRELPQSCPWQIDVILNEEFWPDGSTDGATRL